MTWLGPVVFFFVWVLFGDLSNPAQEVAFQVHTNKIVGDLCKFYHSTATSYSRSPLGFCGKSPIVRCAICIYIYIYYIWILHKYTHIYMTYIKLPVEV